MAAISGQRSFYIDDYSDEVVPCDSTIEGWAAWLASPPVIDDDGDAEWGRDAVPANGTAFSASAILWQEDIVATNTPEGWSLSRQPADDDFVAVRFRAGMGWSADDIVYPDHGEPLGEALVAWLGDPMNGQSDVGETVHIAVGTHEGGWRLTFHAGPPPHLEAERAQ